MGRACRLTFYFTATSKKLIFKCSGFIIMSNPRTELWHLITCHQPVMMRFRIILKSLSQSVSPLTAEGKCHLLVLLDENLHDDVLELEVHDGRHRLLLRPHEGGAEHHAQVRYRHQVLLTVVRHSATQKYTSTRHLYWSRRRRHLLEEVRRDNVTSLRVDLYSSLK